MLVRLIWVRTRTVIKIPYFLCTPNPKPPLHGLGHGAVLIYTEQKVAWIVQSNGSTKKFGATGRAWTLNCITLWTKDSGMRDLRTVRWSFICLRRFLSTAMWVILWASATSLFLQTLGLLRRFFGPCAPRLAFRAFGFSPPRQRIFILEGLQPPPPPPQPLPPTGSSECLVTKRWAAAAAVGAAELVVPEDSRLLKGVAEMVSWMMKFRSSLEDRVSSAILSCFWAYFPSFFLSFSWLAPSRLPLSSQFLWIDSAHTNKASVHMTGGLQTHIYAVTATCGDVWKVTRIPDMYMLCYTVKGLKFKYWLIESIDFSFIFSFFYLDRIVGYFEYGYGDNEGEQKWKWRTMKGGGEGRTWERVVGLSFPFLWCKEWDKIGKMENRCTKIKKRLETKEIYF